MKMTDDISGTMKSIASSSRSLNKEFETLQGKAKALGTRYEALRKSSAESRTEAESLKKEMRELKKVVTAGGEGAADAARDYQKLVEKYDMRQADRAPLMERAAMSLHFVGSLMRLNEHPLMSSKPVTAKYLMRIRN